MGSFDFSVCFLEEAAKTEVQLICMFGESVTMISLKCRRHHMSLHLRPRTCSAGCKKQRCLSINRMWFGLRLFRGAETRGKQSARVTATEDGKRGNKLEGDTIKLPNNEATTSVSESGFWAENQGCWADVKWHFSPCQTLVWPATVHQIHSHWVLYQVCWYLQFCFLVTCVLW